MTNTEITLANSLDFKHIGWKYYNQIRKKVMDKSSASGLVVSLSIAFFIVVFASSFLRICYISLEQAYAEEKLPRDKIYQLEVFYNDSLEKYIQPVNLDINKIDSTSSLGLA